MKVDQELRPVVRKGRKRRWLFGINSGVAVLLVLVLFVMLNYLSYRHYRRWDISRDQFYTLSEKTVGVLAGVTNRLEVKVFFQSGHQLYEHLKNLLEEYEYACPDMQVEWVDPDRDLARAEELAGFYGVNEADIVVFACGDRHRYVTEEDLVKYDYGPLKVAKMPEMTEFGGEQVFSTVIQSLLQNRLPTVYFLQGHGERSPENTDRRLGYSKIALAMEHDNMNVETLRFGEVQRVPEDCDALIIAGPRKDFSVSELDLVRAYLEDNGRIMLLLDAGAETGLELLLEDWGVRLGDDVVVDPVRTLTGRGDLFITQYEEHPLTKKLQGVTSVFYLPRSVYPLEEHLQGGISPADRPQVTVLARSSSEGWAERNLDDVRADFDPDEDMAGPVPLAVAVERGPVQGVDVQIRPTRMLVFGDADFVGNKGVIGGNVDLFLSGLNWLLDRSELMGISPRPVSRITLLITRHQRHLISWFVLLIMPGCVAVLGIPVWLRRRG